MQRSRAGELQLHICMLGMMRSRAEAEESWNQRRCRRSRRYCTCVERTFTVDTTAAKTVRKRTFRFQFY